MNDSYLSDKLNLSGQSSIKNIKGNQDDSDSSMGDILNTSNRSSIKDMKGFQNDSERSMGDILNTSGQSARRSMKGYPNDPNESLGDILNNFGQSSRKRTKEDLNDSQLSGGSSLKFQSQSSISMKGHLNDTGVTAENLIENLQDGNDLSVLEQDFALDKNWLRESEKITEKLEKHLYEVQQNRYRMLDSQDIYLLSNQFTKPDHEVRTYQDEIFRNSVDKNSIFMIETDPRKLSIVMNNILHKLNNHRNKKVVYLCPQIASVEQQAVLIKAIISRSYCREEYSSLLMELQPKVLILHGSKGDDGWSVLGRVDLQNDCKKPIIMITTPQYLLNGLRRSYIKLEEVSLMVFDECHLCLKSHPYNMIMQEFYNCRMNSPEKPQIIGILSSDAPMTFGFKKEDMKAKLTEVCKNLDAKFCTLHDDKIKKIDTRLDVWTFDNDAELDAIDILGLADQGKLKEKFDKIGFLELWNNALNKLFNTIKWETVKMRMLTEDYFRSKVLNKTIALSLELGYYAVYLYFTEICKELSQKYKESNGMKEILSGFLKSIEGYNDKGKISDKCKVFLEKLGKLVQGGRKGVIFVEKKYLGRVLNQIISRNLEGVKTCFGKTEGIEYNALISTNLEQQEVNAEEVKFVISFNEPKTTLSILQIKNSLSNGSSTYNILLSKNTAENRLKAYEFALSLQNTMMEKAPNENKYHYPKDSPQETSENYKGLNTNWADWLSKIYCKSLPPNSIDMNKSFYLMLQQLIHGKPQFTCIMLLPSQCNVRIVLGGTYPVKNDAKRSAALACCEKLIALKHFDKHLNPKSLNKNFTEFANLQTETFESQGDFEDLESTLEGTATTGLSDQISHFAKPFELQKDGKVYRGFLYDIVILNHNTDEIELKIGFVHSSRFLNNFSPAESGVVFQFRGEIKFTQKQYQDYLLIHRYLAAMVKSKPSPLLQYLGVLTSEPPNFYEFEEKELDPNYELWTSDIPCLSFFIIMDEEWNIAQDFLTGMKEYIEYQCQIYQYINSISLGSIEYQLLWDLPQSKGQFLCPKNEKDKLEKYVIQDIWKFDCHRFSEMKALGEIDYHEVKDRSRSLQMREILLVDPFLRSFEDREDEDGFEVETINKKKTEKMVYFEDELMLSPISLELYQNLKVLFEKFKEIKQEELSWMLYEKMLKGYEKEKPQKEKEYLINTESVFDVFDFFGDQFQDYLSLYQPYQSPHKQILDQSSSSTIRKYFDELGDLGLKEKLRELFIVEKYKAEKDKKKVFENLLGEKLIEMLMHIEIFLTNEGDWDYSLEKIKRERMKKFKKESKFFGEIQEFFISSNGNMLFSNPIITRDDLEPFRFSKEYVAKANFGKIVKNTAFYLYDKNQKDLKQTQRFLFKIGLLENESLRIKKEDFDGSKSLSVLERLYTRLKGLETVIDYKFTNKRLLVQALMEISLRDHYVEWTERLAPLLKKTSLFELKERVFQNNGEECPIELPPLSIEEIFPDHVPNAINYYHSNVNEMDRLRWLGEGLVQYYITEWVYESDGEFSKRMNIELEIKARYLTEERFIAAVAWKYNLEDCLLAHHNCYNQLKLLKQRMSPKELFIKSLSGNEMERRLCFISASLFYSLIGAIFLDSLGDFEVVQEVILELMTSVAKKHSKGEFILEYAVYKLEKYCEVEGLEKPVIKKFAVEDFTMPASSKYVLFIGDDECSSLISTSLKKVEYALYVLACEKLYL